MNPYPDNNATPVDESEISDILLTDSEKERVVSGCNNWRQRNME
jgi:hypothetical protein